jgi:signal transduction histidine kinase
LPITSRSFVQLTAVLLLVGLLALATIVAAAFWLGIRTNRSFADVLAARTIRTQTVQLLGSLQDAETGQRGFLLTGRQDYLEPYTKAIVAIPDEVNRLNQLIGADPALHDAWGDVKPAVSAKLAEIAQTVGLKQAGQDDQALAVVNTDKGKRLMDQARTDFSKLIDLAEQRILAAEADQQWNQGTLSWVAVIGAIVIVIVVGGSSITVFRYTRELGAARDEIAAANAGLERRVAERTQDLAQANEEIQRFAYVVTHDLRAPLVNIMGFTAELETSVAEIKAYLDKQSDPGSDPAAAEAQRAVDADLPESIGFIRSSTRKMDGLISAILKLAREGGRAPKPERIDLGQLLAAAIEPIQHQITAAEGEVAIDDAAPPIVSDRLALEQVLGNLLDNAVKYRAPERPLRLSMQARLALADRIEIELSDNGRGIAPTDHERVFELFRRSGVQNQPGEGIGLAYVRRLVRNLGGDIKLRSELGKGTTFTVILPRTFQPLQGSMAK